jgi:hypothetical protein
MESKMKALVTMANKPEPKTRQELINVLYQSHLLIESAYNAAYDDILSIHDNEFLELKKIRYDVKKFIRDMSEKD